MAAEIKPISGIDDRVPLAEVVPLSTPFTMNIFPTNACNFRCNYCAQSLGPKILKDKYNFEYENMSMKVFETAVEQMKAFSKPFKLMSFMGHGEPLLNKNLPEMIRIAKKAGVADRFEIITNGSCLTHELSKQLIDAGLSALRISLQGLSSAKYLEISNVKLDFDSFLEELEFFYSIRKNSKLFVKVVDTSLENGEEEKFYDLFCECSDRMYIEHIKPVYNGVKYETSTHEVTSDRYGNFHKKRMVCPLCFYMLSLWPNGDVVPCDAIYKPLTLGNVMNNKLLEMWKSEKLRNFWKLQLEKKRMNYSGCSLCCAPDDVSHSLDVLDNNCEEILGRIER